MTTRPPTRYPALSAFEGPSDGALGGVLAVHAHPDDETLTTGGLLATFAAAGLPVCVVTCTRGERGEVIALPGTTSEGRATLEGDGPALGAYREAELAGALVRLAGDADGAGAGAIEHAFLDTLPPAAPQVTGATHAAGPSNTVRYEDSGMVWVAPGVAGPAPDSPATAFARVPLDESAGRLAGLIRVRRPAVVATYEPGGGYGHPDHVRTHEVTVRALELAADPAWRPGGMAAPAPVPAHEGVPDDDAGRQDVPWTGAELWQAVTPAAELREARVTLAALPAAVTLAASAGLTFPDPAADLPPLARADLDGARTVRVDVGPVLDRVTAALRAHATQVQHTTTLAGPQGQVAGWYALSNDVLAPILTRETYAVVPAGRTSGA